MSGAVWALRTTATLDDVNIHLAALAEAGLLGMAEEHGQATIYLTHRPHTLPLEGSWERVEPRDWNTTWKAGFDPVTVGEVAVVAPWHDPDTPARVTLVVEPAQAFGTGHHETTTACLSALQQLDLCRVSVLDVGTGTGILALAAKALGAGRVLAVDVDPLAVTAAADNAVANGLDVEVVQGSVSAAAGEQFGVVVANLDTATLSRLAPDLAAALAPGGTFIGSGVNNARLREAVAALQAAGLDVEAVAGTQWGLLTGSSTPA